MMREQDRPPVSTYAQAVFWLLQHAEPENWLWDAAADIPPAAKLVTDMFWISQNELIRDLKREWNSLTGAGRPRRHLFTGGARCSDR